jgi:hypothetical protein
MRSENGGGPLNSQIFSTTKNIAPTVTSSLPSTLDHDLWEKVYLIKR